MVDIGIDQKLAACIVKMYQKKDKERKHIQFTKSSLADGLLVTPSVMRGQAEQMFKSYVKTL